MKLGKISKRTKKIITVASIVSILVFIVSGAIHCVFFPGAKLRTYVLENEKDVEMLASSGSGEMNDPYIIENIVFGKFTDHNRKRYTFLKIESIDFALVIQNCSFNGAQTSIEITDTVSGIITIRNCTIESGVVNCGCGWNIGTYYPEGIVITNSNNIRIENNVFSGNMLDAIDIKLASNIQIENNRAIFEHTISAIEISNSTISGNLNFEGIYLTNSDNITFGYNNVGRFQLIGDNYRIFDNVFHADSSVSYEGKNTIIYRNLFLFEGRGNGLYIRSSSNCTIFLNTFSESYLHALELAYSSNITVYHNNFHNNSISPYMHASYVSQCMEYNCENTYWYNPLLLEGNYWSDLENRTTYPIDDVDDTTFDLYPLIEPITLVFPSPWF